MKAVATSKPGKPVIVFFQETKPDDIDKYFIQSNNADTGGGARDLRIRPPDEFWRDLSPFFQVEISARQRSGTIYSADKRQDNKTVSAEVSLWGPTNTRNEVRIGRFYAVAGWEIPADEFNSDFTNGIAWFYLLVLDDNNNVWARTMRSTTIGKNDPGFDACVSSALRRKSNPKKTAARGVYHFPKHVITIK
jgi:hypothetical protein